MIVATANSEKAKAALLRLKQMATPEAVDKIVDRAGFETQAALVTATPKKWFGQVRRGWNVTAPAKMERLVSNPNKIMRFLEFGTANGGQGFIQAKNKKALFIALARRAAAGWNSALKYGLDYILRRRVRGIKPRHIVENERPRAIERVREGVKALVRKAVHG